MRICLALLMTLAPVCAGCSSGASTPIEDPPVPVSARETPAPADENADSHQPSSDEATDVSVSGFRFRAPAGWRQVELSPAQQGFIDARFEIPGHGDDVRLTFATMGGGVTANIERWVGQFRLPEGTVPKLENFEVDGVPVTWVDMSGEYQGMGQSTQPNWRLLGAAFDGEPRDFYIKLTGPESVLAELEPEFREFVRSARREN